MSVRATVQKKVVHANSNSTVFGSCILTQQGLVSAIRHVTPIAFDGRGLTAAHAPCCKMESVGKKALLILAPGAEEMETVITADVLRRAKITVVIAGLDSAEAVECSRQVKILPDTSLDIAAQQGPYDVVILPGGGGGAKRLSDSPKVQQLLQTQEASGQYIAAVCAAPTALLSHGIAKGKQITSHPAVKSVIEESGNYRYTEARVSRDGTIITSRGPGTCFEFSLAIVSALVGEEKATEIAKPMILP